MTPNKMTSSIMTSATNKHSITIKWYGSECSNITNHAECHCNDTHHNDTQHRGLNYTRQIIISYCYSEFLYSRRHYSECYYAWRDNAGSHFVKCHYAECHFTECFGAKKSIDHCLRVFSLLTEKFKVY